MNATNCDQRSGLLPVIAGDSWNYSAWFRDTSSAGLLTSNGIERNFQ